MVGILTLDQWKAVKIVTALPAGSNALGIVQLAAGANLIGAVRIDAAIPAGTNNIGDVDIASALPTGNNNIGNVDVVTLPSLAAGTNEIGKLAAGVAKIGFTNIATTPENETASATSSEGSKAYAAARKSHIIVNDGAASAYINFDATATTSNYELKAGEVLSIDLEFQTLHYITSSGTAALRWLGVS